MVVDLGLVWLCATLEVHGDNAAQPQSNAAHLGRVFRGTELVLAITVPWKVARSYALL